jgi:hypothetical protein
MRCSEPFGRIVGFTGHTGNRALMIEATARLVDELHHRHSRMFLGPSASVSADAFTSG